ncbi:4'-phosphopantetheinyl transferase family protein [Streptomyces sp. NPDC008001]|uniref:4'-phosphopantetheinyl transferase family protein n=1 Tax=Streptomyces sp. NPDC008001 TaxID=3364804 RepID=UPI0036ED0688
MTGDPSCGVRVTVWAAVLRTGADVPRDTAGKRRMRAEARAWVRDRLAERLRVPPARLEWERSRAGKPRLAGDRGLHVSYSHSGGAVVLAACAGGPVGADVEHVVARPHLDELAAGCLAPPELAAWRSAAQERAADGFARLWTRKEAVLKAWGRGFPGSLAEVVTGPGGRSGEPAVLALPEALGPAGLWTVRDLPAPDGYRAAVACRAPAARVVVVPAEVIRRPGAARA